MLTFGLLVANFRLDVAILPRTVTQLVSIAQFGPGLSQQDREFSDFTAGYDRFAMHQPSMSTEIAILWPFDPDPDFGRDALSKQPAPCC